MKIISSALISLALLAGAVAPAAAQSYYDGYDYPTIKRLDKEGRGGHGQGYHLTAVRSPGTNEARLSWIAGVGLRLESSELGVEFRHLVEWIEREAPPDLSAQPCI